MRNRLKNIPSRVYIRYGLLTIPGTLVLILILVIVRNWVPIPFWLQAGLIVLWIAKEVILFPFIWRAYDHTRSEVSGSMIGQRGLARQCLAPDGYIQVQGELWKAEKMPGEPPIEKDMWVRVIKIEGLKLFVVPENADDRGQRTEDRGQMTEHRRQRAEGRGPRADSIEVGSGNSAFDELPSACSGPEPVERQARQSREIKNKRQIVELWWVAK